MIPELDGPLNPGAMLVVAVVCILAPLHGYSCTIITPPSDADGPSYGRNTSLAVSNAAIPDGTT